GTPSLQALLAAVKLQVAKSKPGEWIVGAGWIETFFKPPVFPTRFDLDSVAPNNPVYLTRVDGHAAVANSLALAKAHITRDTPSPDGGEISKDKSGEPNGMIIDNARRIFTPLLPRESEEQLDEAVVKGAEFAAAHGLCEVQVAGGLWPDV